MADPPTVFVPLQHRHRFLPYVEVVEQAGGQVDFVDIEDTEKRRAALARATAGAVGLDSFGADDFAVAPRLRAVITCTTGVDPIDLEAATEHGVMVGNTPDLCIEEVADHTLMLLLSCYRRLPRTVHPSRSGAPAREGVIDFSEHWPRLRGQVAGLLGFGNIARAVATRCQAFGLRVIAYDPYVDPSVAEEFGVQLTGFNEVLEAADYLCVHLPLNPATRHCLNAEAFARMKPTAFVINTARGPIIDEPALVEALQTGQVAGAGLDVTEVEPITEDNPLLDIPDALLTPHSAGYSQEASRWGPESALRCAAAVIQGGRPRSIQNPGVLERLKT